MQHQFRVHVKDHVWRAAKNGVLEYGVRHETQARLPVRDMPQQDHVVITQRPRSDSQCIKEKHQEAGSYLGTDGNLECSVLRVLQFCRVNPCSSLLPIQTFANAQ